MNFGLAVVLVRVSVGVKFRLGLTPSLKLTLTIPNLNLTYFGLQPVISDVIATGEKYVNEYLPFKQVLGKQVTL